MYVQWIKLNYIHISEPMISFLWVKVLRIHLVSLYYLNIIYLDLGAQTSLEAGSVSQPVANQRPVSGPVTNQRPALVTEEESPELREPSATQWRRTQEAVNSPVSGVANSAFLESIQLGDFDWCITP